MRQRVELAGVNTAWDQVVARAFRRARRQDWRLKFQKALLRHPAANAGDHLGPEDDVVVNLFAAQIEEAVAQTLLFRDVLSARHLKRERFGRRQDFDRVDDDLDEPGWQRGVDVLFSPGDHASGDVDDAFESDRLGNLERRRVGREHALGDAIVISKVDERS